MLEEENSRLDWSQEGDGIEEMTVMNKVEGRSKVNPREAFNIVKYL
jgi:hypothetical protein